MLLLSLFLAILALVLAELSWKCLIYYSVCFAVSLWLVHLFLVNKCELDFDVVFKTFEWMGYGTPRLLDGRTIPTSENNAQEQYTNRIPKPISDSLDKFVNNVLRDFVKSWYEEVANDDVFVSESRTVLNRLAAEVHQRTNYLDSHYLVQQVILVFHSHLVRYNKSVTVLKEKDPNLRLTLTYSELLHSTYDSQVQPKHIALTNSVAELNYLRTVVDTLLAALTPQDVYSCDLGRFILREIIAVQTVELIDLLCDPHWVNRALVDLLTPPAPKKQQLALQNLTRDNLKSISEHFDTAGRENKSLTPACEGGIHNSEERSETTTNSKEVIISEVKQVFERQTSEDSDKLDNAIIYSSKGDSNNSRQKEESLMGFDCTNNANVNKPSSKSTVEIPPLVERQASDQEVKSSFASSWGYCPSPKDTSFHTQSFEAMKAKALERERKLNSTQKVKAFGTEVRKLGLCCTSFEVSEELHTKSKESTKKIRYLSSSVPNELQNMQDHPDQGSASDYPIKRGVTRSISFPTNMSSAIVNEEQPCVPINRSVRSTTFNDPSHIYGSPYQNLSFCSSEASFKSFSDDDLDLEEAKEMDEGSESDTGEILENIAPLPIMKPTRRKSIARQAEVVEDAWFGSNEKPSSVPEYTTQSINGKITENGLYRKQSNSQSSKDSDLLEPKSPTSPYKLDSDQSFGDTVIMAGRKFISSIRSPVRKFGFSSSSSKSSTSMSSGAESMEVNVPSSIDTASFDSDLPLHRPVKTDSPSTGRKLSRCNAVIDISSESDTETWYGTSPNVMKEEIVYGSISSASARNDDGVDAVRIHPSQMISIPTSETAFESDWEPGRNKFTLYRIEYDIRIWPSVYSSLLEQDNQSQQDHDNNDKPKEQQKRSFHHRRAIKRRYREFMELHSRLSSGPLALFMKDILKPNRKYNLPFGRLDKDVVEGRRSLLQYYLVSLVSKPELRDSHELQQFLGVIGGGSFIKPSVAQIMSQSVHVPRVDKMLSRQMTKVIDSIKTAFDSDDQEGDESGKVSPVLYIGCPWTVECHGEDSESTTWGENQAEIADYFSAFLENLEFSKLESWYHDKSDTESGFSDSSSDSDAIPDVLIDLVMANDRTDIPNEPSTASCVSNDDMLNGVLGSKPPGLCIPHSYSYSGSHGSSFERDAVDFGNHFLKKDKKVSTSTGRNLGDKPFASDGSSENIPKTSGQIGFSRKHVEKMKTAAKKAKQKKAESLDSLNSAKDKVKKKIPSAENLENLAHAKEKVKAFKKSVELMENLNQAKEKVKHFKKKIPDVESMENLSQAKEKVKALKRKIPSTESLENIKHAKQKVKAFKKNVESMENLSHAKDKVKAFKKKIPDADSMENLTHAKEKVKAFKRKIPSTESSEGISHAKDKVKELKKKIPNPEKFIKKDQETFENNQQEPSQLVNELQFKVKPEKPLLLSTCDDPSEPVLSDDIFPEDPQFPLTHAILNLTCEVLKGHESWAGLERVQESFKGTFGALFEWFIRGEIDDILTDQCWSEYLENLNDVVWPNGKLIEPEDDKKSEDELAKNKRKAVQTLIEFFPEIFQLLVGSKVYQECAANVVESLQNPAINRILIYILLELFLSELVPELQRSIYTDVNDESE